MPFYIPYSIDNCPIPNGNMLRKPHCDFGWDWNIALASFGLWGNITLAPHGERIDDIVVSQLHSKGAVDVTLRIYATGVDVTATLCGVTQTARVIEGVAELVLPIKNPILWWPTGQGAQILHGLTVTMGSVVERRRIGLRALELVSEIDAVGRSFGFKVNGRAVFAKGANWIPADALHGRITPEAVRDLLQSAVDANMNMIRIWGGGRYEPDWFYDLCDEMGLMIWQDFMFACSLYPSTEAFLAEVNTEVRDVVRRLNHHACIALWCGDNELVGALTWFKESRADRDRYLASYDRLNHTIQVAVQQTLPDANWWASSPSSGPLSFGDAWHDDKSGDMHFWSVWHEGKDFDHYRDVSPRFCSEFGFQSYPSMDVIATFADPADWNIASPVMESHQKNRGGNARIAETMFRYFRFPVDFPNFVYLSQIQQGLAIKTAVTHWRSLKPHCMGTLIWQLNDTWPVCSWSSLDYGGGWKLLHHMAKQFYAPFTVVAVPQEGQILLRAVSDLARATTIDLRVLACDMRGATRLLAEVKQEVSPDHALELAHIPLQAVQAGEVLLFTWDIEGEKGSDVFAPKPWKTYDLLAPNLSHTIAKRADDYVITVESQTLAVFVAIEASGPGRMNKNAVMVFPGHPVEFVFKPKLDGATPQFTLRDLHSATYGA
jgi:beta-mannosidase